MEENVTSAKRKHANLEEMAEKNTYVSRFEKLTDTTSKPKNDYKPKRKKTSGCSVESASKEKKKSENLLLNVSITG